MYSLHGYDIRLRMDPKQCYSFLTGKMSRLIKSYHGDFIVSL